MYLLILEKNNGVEYLIVCFERPREDGFDTVIFELPSYDILKKDGNYTDKEIDMFKTVVETGTAYFLKLQKNY